ncbi:MAG: class I SAM-dependent methyltransferase [Pseudomonadota bacterium]
MTQSESRVAPHPVLSDYYETEDDRRARVDGMFDASAAHYDWINSVMSFGTGQWYRRDALIRLGVEPGMTVLDAGSGTGVVARIEQDLVGSEGLVVALDPSRGMLGEALKRGVKLTTQGLGETLPFRDNQFDRVTMSYALRHVVDLGELFAEYLRVLKPGGRLLILEITKPEGLFARSALYFHLKIMVPTLTRIFRRSVEAQELMRYYWDTIEHCVSPDTIMETMAASNLVEVQRKVMLGTFSEYTAAKSTSVSGN